MSRYTITVTASACRHIDPDATIGYDRPLQTFFLQAFPDAEGEDLELWLGTDVREFETLSQLRTAAVAVLTSYRCHPAYFTNCWTITSAKRVIQSAIQSSRIS